MTLTLEPSEFAPTIEQRFKEIQANVQLKGFRKGKAPMELIRRLMGKEIEADAIEFLANKFFSEIVEEKKLKLVGKARLRHFEYVPNEKLTIYMQYEVEPEFELKPFEDYTFTKIQYDISEEDIDREIKQMLAEQGVWVSKGSEAGPDDLVIADLQKLDSSGLAIIGTRYEQQEFVLANLSSESSLKKALLGTKAGDERIVDVELKKDDGKVEPARFKVSVKDVKRLDLPELTDELAKELSGGRCQTTAELREDIRRALQEYYEAQSEDNLMEEIAQRFVRDNPVEVPPSLVRSFENMIVENARQRFGGVFPRNFSEASFRSTARQSAELQARWMLIRYKIASQYNLTVTPEDFKTEAEKTAAETGLDAQRLLQAYTSEGMKEQIYDRILRDKVFDFLKSKVKIVTEKRPLSSLQNPAPASSASSNSPTEPVSESGAQSDA